MVGEPALQIKCRLKLQFQSSDTISVGAGSPTIIASKPTISKTRPHSLTQQTILMYIQISGGAGTGLY